MKIAILLKSGPRTEEAERALQIASDMLAQGHEVSLYLLQEAVRFCRPGPVFSNSMDLEELIEKGFKVYALASDARLRAIDVAATEPQILEGSYESLVELMESCDRVVGIL